MQRKPSVSMNDSWCAMMHGCRRALKMVASAKNKKRSNLVGGWGEEIMGIRDFLKKPGLVSSYVLTAVANKPPFLTLPLAYATPHTSLGGFSFFFSKLSNIYMLDHNLNNFLK
jgi:hypothetical protein